jgi:hypothetical protein
MSKNKIKLEDFEEVGIQPSRVMKFFYGLMLTKKPNPRPTNDVDMIPWALKHYSGVMYFVLEYIYHKFITWITQYYPFSLLWPNSLIHANNKLLNKFVLKVEKLAKTAKLPFLICGNGYDGTVYSFDALLNKDENTEFIKSLELLLQKELGTAYIRRDSPKKIRIIIPNETMQAEYLKLE